MNRNFNLLLIYFQQGNHSSLARVLHWKKRADKEGNCGERELRNGNWKRPCPRCFFAFAHNDETMSEFSWKWNSVLFANYLRKEEVPFFSHQCVSPILSIYTNSFSSSSTSFLFPDSTRLCKRDAWFPLSNFQLPSLLNFQLFHQVVFLLFLIELIVQKSISFLTVELRILNCQNTNNGGNYLKE